MEVINLFTVLYSLRSGLARSINDLCHANKPFVTSDNPDVHDILRRRISSQLTRAERNLLVEKTPGSEGAKNVFIITSAAARQSSVASTGSRQPSFRRLPRTSACPPARSAWKAERERPSPHPTRPNPCSPEPPSNNALARLQPSRSLPPAPHPTPSCAPLPPNPAAHRTPPMVSRALGHCSSRRVRKGCAAHGARLDGSSTAAVPGARCSLLLQAMGGAWGSDGVCREKRKNGRLLHGRTWDAMPPLNTMARTSTDSVSTPCPR
jgi:hypothetical protein